MRRLLLFMLFAVLWIPKLHAQEEKLISGTVKDNLNRPIPSISVLVKGSNIGAMTDAGGNFKIPMAGSTGILIFSGVGYEDQEVSVARKDNINVILQEKNMGIDEVVVMGYSTVDKKHVASSVAQMDMTVVKTRPIFKMQQAFSGTIAGVTMMQGNNLPGSVPGNITIRGVSTLQNAAPLVIVDGMEQSLTDIDPAQVKSLTVLKDAASASMYGSRGANGVIIIETERGSTGQFKVDLNAWAAVDNPIDLPNFVDATRYMKLNNEAKNFQGQAPLFTDEDIRKAESGETGSVNWLDEVIQKRSFAQNETASVSGGGGVGTFNLMVGHLQQSGLNSID
ncbi:carboxypeptidase-like regulatory domain-containing protein [Sphingobacterium sp. MYb382]|uniref:carboxypeptidase-like regulatory domain-containing protein n=1 Tax=Sphingobacterium sp. MYb382 TaxID=2745278 RepID=UPI0030AF5DFC